ncbi:NUDIX domain-containing protein [Candidatus Woesearchaeota archaeon]|jgi:ADP-ribose pyrophosphatase YjhB (NUDIX family)|nr:NUDIX domain-containing protein [Candidatus Woesearchaeota archaeon]MBT4733121.1 NUDIX domain-containing protein [Candidatus Woesearchaeota archaeon]MBT7555546.1 NUDIX domain-containing protein [Candidatus Woesearchaeota archaeon]
MKIKNTWIEESSGLEATAEYEDVDSFTALPYEKCQQVACFAFYKNKLLLVHNGNTKSWGPAGGCIEKPETFEDCARRELAEEANVEMLSFKPIGYQKAYLPNEPKEYQLRVFCEVKPIGKFEKDPDGDITKIKYINPTEYRKYFDWGDIGERLIERAMELKEKL